MATYGSVEFFPSCDLNTVARSCADRSAFGHVAKVGLFHADQGFDDNSLALPMLRGHGRDDPVQWVGVPTDWRLVAATLAIYCIET